MIDGIYQSVICFFMTYLLFHTGGFASSSGRDLNSRELMGVYVGCSAIAVVNTYVLMNQYRWDWLFVLVTSISILMIWLWTGIYSAFTSSGAFYQSAEHVYGALSFWATTLLTVMVCLIPRFSAKVIQKLYFPRDVDIVREQVRLGEFKHLYDGSEDLVVSQASSTTSSDIIKPSPQSIYVQDDDRRPIYPPSVAPTAATAGKRASGNGSNGSDGSGYTGGAGTGTFTPHRYSMDTSRPRPSMDRGRPSMDRVRMSLDVHRPARASFEITSDFTSAAMLARMESSNSVQRRGSVLGDPR